MSERGGGGGGDGDGGGGGGGDGDTAAAVAAALLLLLVMTRRYAHCSYQCSWLLGVRPAQHKSHHLDGLAALLDTFLAPGVGVHQLRREDGGSAAVEVG